MFTYVSTLLHTMMHACAYVRMCASVFIILSITVSVIATLYSLELCALEVSVLVYEYCYVFSLEELCVSQDALSTTPGCIPIAT